MLCSLLFQAENCACFQAFIKQAFAELLWLASAAEGSEGHCWCPSWLSPLLCPLPSQYLLWPDITILNSEQGFQPEDS